MQRIAIIGTGLMGGSLGLALREADPSLAIRGFDDPVVLNEALRKGAITESANSLQEAVHRVNAVVLAAPVDASIKLLKRIAPHLEDGTVVHDLCSVKSPIAAVAAEVLPPSCYFVGGHPMTGSEKSGVRHADAVLYENATYVLCPDNSAAESAEYGALKDLLGSIGARLLEMDADRHDRIASQVSHLPQLLAVLLVNQAESTRKSDADVLDLAAGGFRDMTRIASSSFGMWRDILTSNKDAVLASLSEFDDRISALKNDLERGDLEAIRERFQAAEQTRDFIPVDRKGFLKPLADVYVFTSDRPGALVDMTSALHEADLSIKDIELLRIRENTGGTFRIGFDTVVEADRAVQTLGAAEFVAYRL